MMLCWGYRRSGNDLLLRVLTVALLAWPTTGAVSATASEQRTSRTIRVGSSGYRFAAVAAHGSNLRLRPGGERIALLCDGVSARAGRANPRR